MKPKFNPSLEAMSKEIYRTLLPNKQQLDSFLATPTGVLTLQFTRRTIIEYYRLGFVSDEIASYFDMYTPAKYLVITITKKNNKITSTQTQVKG